MMGFSQPLGEYIPIEHSCGPITGTKLIADCPYKLIQHQHINDHQTFSIIGSVPRRNQLMNESTTTPISFVNLDVQHEEASVESYYMKILQVAREHIHVKLFTIANKLTSCLDTLTVRDRFGNSSFVFSTRPDIFPPSIFLKPLNLSKNFQFIYNRHGLLSTSVTIIYPQYHEAFHEAEPVIFVIPDISGIQVEANNKFSFKIVKSFELMHPTATCYSKYIHVYKNRINFIHGEDSLFKVTVQEGEEF